MRTLDDLIDDGVVDFINGNMLIYLRHFIDIGEFNEQHNILFSAASIIIVKEFLDINRCEFKKSAFDKFISIEYEDENSDVETSLWLSKFGMVQLSLKSPKVTKIFQYKNGIGKYRYHNIQIGKMVSVPINNVPLLTDVIRIINKYHLDSHITKYSENSIKA